MEAAGDHRIQECELVVVVVVEGGAINGRRLGDVLDGDIFKAFCLQQVAQGSLEELAGAADARVADFAVGNRHDNSLDEGNKEKSATETNRCRLQ